MRLFSIALAAACVVSLAAVSGPANAGWDHGRNWRHGEHRGEWHGHHHWREREHTWHKRHRQHHRRGWSGHYRYGY